jgi:hypothetical protein
VATLGASQPFQGRRRGAVGQWCLVLVIAVQSAVLLENAFAEVVPKWGVIGYLSGDGGLERDAERYSLAATRAARQGHCTAAVQVDGPYVCARWYAMPEGEPVYQPLGAVNMAARQTIADFMSSAVARITARMYVLIVMGHGTGLATLGPDLCGIAFDGGAGRCLSAMDVADAIGGANGFKGRLEVICLDSCHGASIELAHGLKDCCNYLVASPSRLRAPGLPWHQILPMLNAQPDGRSLVGVLISHHDEPLTAVHMPKIDGVTDALTAFVEAVLSDLPRVAPLLRLVRSRTKSLGYRDEMCDLRELTARVAQCGMSPDITYTATQLIDSLDGALVGRMDPSTANADIREGQLGIYFPASWEPVPSQYLHMYSMARDTGWAKLLETYYEACGLVRH